MLQKRLWILASITLVLVFSTTAGAQHAEEQWHAFFSPDSSSTHWTWDILLIDDLLVYSATRSGDNGNGGLYLIAYNHDGEQQWVIEEEIEGVNEFYEPLLARSSDDAFYCVVDLKEGEGTSHTTTPMIYRISTDGDILWQQSMGINHSHGDIAVDEQGDLYVLSNEGETPFLSKWNKNGEQVFSKTISDNPGMGVDIGIDGYNKIHVYILGFLSSGNTGTAMAVYSIDGDLLHTPDWDDAISSVDRDIPLLLRDDGIAFTVNQDQQTVSYAKWDYGQRLWVKTMGISNTEFVYGATLQDRGFAFVVIREIGETEFQNLYFSFDEMGAENWTYSEEVNQVTYLASGDQYGNLYATGITIDLEDEDDDPEQNICTSKVTNFGEAAWSIIFESEDYDNAMGLNQVLDEKGNYYVLGQIWKSGHSSDFVLIKYKQICDAGQCFIENNCYSAGAHSPDNPCMVCDPTISEYGWSEGDGLSCSNGLYCDGNSDVCVAGQCIGDEDPCEDGQTCDEDTNSCENLDGDVTGDNFAQDEDNGGCCG